MLNITANDNAQLWWRKYSSTKTCLLCWLRNVLTAILDCYRYTYYCNWASHMLHTVFRIQSVDIASIVFSTELFRFISFAETNIIGAVTQFTLHIHVIYVKTQWDWDIMTAISQTTLSNALSWMKMFEYRWRFHWSLFLRVQSIIFQHWFR